MKAPYKYVIDVDHSGNNIYNVSKIVGNDFEFPTLSYDRNLLVTTCDNDDGKTGNLLIRTGQGQAPTTDSGYLHLWAGTSAQPFSESDATDGIIIHPDTSIKIRSSAQSVVLESQVETKLESAITLSLVRGASNSTYTNESIVTNATLYDLNTTNIDIDNTNDASLLTKSLDVQTTLTESGDNYASASKFILSVDSNTSKMTLKDIHSFGTIDALHENISGDIVIGNTYTNGTTGVEKYDRTLTAKGGKIDVEYDGVQAYVHEHADDVFRLIAFGSKKPTVAGTAVAETKDYSKLTIQHIDALKTFNFKGTDLDLGNTDFGTDIAIDAKTLVIKSKDTDEYHDVQNVYSGFTSTDYGTENIKNARYKLAVTKDNARLDLDDLYATNHIDSKGTLTVTGLTTLNGNLNLKDSIEAVNTAKSLDIKADKYVIKSVANSHSYITVDNTDKSINLDSELFTLNAGPSNARTLVIENGDDSGNKPVTSDTYTALVGDSYINVDSAEIDNETVGTSNIGTINNKTLLNVDGQVDIDSANIAIDSAGTVNVTTTAEATYAEKHSGKYAIDANTYHVEANTGADSTVTADNLKTNKTIKTDGTLDADGLTTLSANVVLDNTNGNLISATNGISIKSQTFDLKSTDASSTSYFGASYENAKTNLNINPDTIHIYRGDTTSANNILDFDGATATARVDDFHATSATVDNMDVNDLDVTTKLHGKGNIEMTGSTIATVSTGTSSLTSSTSHTETHKGSYTLNAGGDGTYPLAITAGSSASALTMTGATAHITGTTTLDGIKVNLNAPVEVTKTITLADSADSNSLITSDNKITIESNDILLKDKGTNTVELTNSSGLDCDLNKFTLDANDLHITSAYTSSGKSRIDVDHVEMNTGHANTSMSAPSGTFTTLGSTNATLTNLTTSGKVLLNSSDFDSTCTDADVNFKDFTLNAGYGSVSSSAVLKISAPTTETGATIGFKGNTTLTGTLSTSGLTTATGGLKVSTINNLDGNASMGITASDTLTLKGTKKLDASGTALSFKFGTPSSEALDINVVGNTATVNATDINATTIGKSGDIQTLNVKDINISGSLKIKDFAIYWDEASQSIVFEKV